MTPTRTKPIPGVMIGLTHDGNATPLIRAVKATRVGIGIPKGKAVLVYIDGDPKERSTWIWKILFGQWVPPASGNGDPKFKMVEVFSTKSAAEAESWYLKNRDKAADPGYPQKISFFTFTKKSVISEAKKIEEFQEPDFAAIAAHGPRPKEIDILLMDENPLLINEYAMYSKSEKQCYGDGEIGMRVLSMAKSAEEKKLAEEAKASGERYFPVLNGCATNGCPYYPNGGCKPSLTMAFQLMNSLRIGSTAFFTTTAINSSWKINSGIADLRSKARSIAGKPVKLCVSPIRTNHIDPKTQKAMPGLSYGVHIELRAEDLEQMRKMLSSGWMEQEQPRAIAAAAAPLEDGEEIQTASEIAGEFYVERDDEDSAPADIPPAGVKSNEKVAALEEQLKAAKAATPPPPTPASDAATTAPASKVEAPSPGPVAVPDPKQADKPGPVAVPNPTPWPDRKAMNSAIIAAKNKVGDVEFSRIAGERKIVMGSAQHTDPVVYEFFKALEARWVEMQAPATAPSAPVPAPPDEDRLF